MKIQDRTISTAIEDSNINPIGIDKTYIEHVSSDEANDSVAVQQENVIVYKCHSYHRQISYDIITKGHGGNLSFISLPGQEAEFVITLPTEPTVA